MVWLWELIWLSQFFCHPDKSIVNELRKKKIYNINKLPKPQNQMDDHKTKSCHSF